MDSKELNNGIEKERETNKKLFEEYRWLWEQYCNLIKLFTYGQKN